jgi:hypothetical protein
LQKEFSKAICLQYSTSKSEHFVFFPGLDAVQAAAKNTYLCGAIISGTKRDLQKEVLQKNNYSLRAKLIGATIYNVQYQCTPELPQLFRTGGSS